MCSSSGDGRDAPICSLGRCRAAILGRHTSTTARTRTASEETQMLSRTLAGATGLSALGLSVGLATGSADASVAVNQSYPVPASRVMTLHGHGFGHGHGMSQYGAYGAAKQGLTYRQIIGFYYPAPPGPRRPARCAC